MTCHHVYINDKNNIVPHTLKIDYFNKENKLKELKINLLERTIKDTNIKI